MGSGVGGLTGFLCLGPGRRGVVMPLPMRRAWGCRRGAFLVLVLGGWVLLTLVEGFEVVPVRELGLVWPLVSWLV